MPRRTSGNSGRRREQSAVVVLLVGVLITGALAGRCVDAAKQQRRSTRTPAGARSGKCRDGLDRFVDPDTTFGGRRVGGDDPRRQERVSGADGPLRRERSALCVGIDLAGQLDEPTTPRSSSAQRPSSPGSRRSESRSSWPRRSRPASPRSTIFSVPPTAGSATRSRSRLPARVTSCTPKPRCRKDRRARIDQNSAFNNFDYAIYLSDSERADRSHRVQCSVERAAVSRTTRRLRTSRSERRTSDS